MSMILTQEVIQSLRHSGGDIRLMALLTDVRRDFSDDQQLVPTPNFQRGLTGYQFAATTVTAINAAFHFFRHLFAFCLKSACSRSMLKATLNNHSLPLKTSASIQLVCTIHWL
jgi:hypothetical protein